MGSFFDLILIFIFIVLPVISNLLKANQKRKKGQGAPKNQPRQQAGQGNTQQSPTQPQSAQPVVVKRPEPTSTSSGSGDKAEFERRLAEARAKVQQSMSDGSGARNPAQRPQTQRPQTQSPQIQRPQAQRPQANTAQARQAQPSAKQVVPAQQTRQQAQPQTRPQQRSLEVLNPLGGKTAKAKSIESASLEGQSLERSFRTPASAPRQSLLGSSKIGPKTGANGLFGGLSKQKVSKHTTKESDKLLTMDDKSIMRGLIWKQILDTPKSKKRISNYNKIR